MTSMMQLWNFHWPLLIKGSPLYMYELIVAQTWGLLFVKQGLSCALYAHDTHQKNIKPGDTIVNVFGIMFMGKYHAYNVQCILGSV